MKIIDSLPKFSFALVSFIFLPAFFLSCAGGGERSSISKPVGQLRNIQIESGQMWSGSYKPDGKGNGGAFSMLISEVDAQGNFNGYMKTELLFNGTGPISGKASGSKLSFTLQHAAYPSYYEYYNCSYSDQLRGRYESKTKKSAKGFFNLALSAKNEGDFMQAYNRIVVAEKSELARKQQSQQKTIVYRNTPSYNNAPRQSFSEWESQHRQEQLMERQTEAMEQMQRDASWNTFEQNQRALFKH